MDINKPNQPFAVACVLDFKLVGVKSLNIFFETFFLKVNSFFKKTKRDNVVIEVRWYFRPNEIPDSVYIPLMQDRVTEIGKLLERVFFY